MSKPAESTESTTFRLESDENISAPGILQWAMNGYNFQRDRAAMIRVMKSWETTLTDAQWGQILEGKIPHTIEGDTVIITV